MEEIEPIKRDEKGRWVKGNPPGPGRPIGKTLKEFQAQKFREMTDEEKEEWLKTNRVSGDTKWKMAEGNPKQDTELSGGLNIGKVLDEVEDE